MYKPALPPNPTSTAVALAEIATKSLRRAACLPSQQDFSNDSFFDDSSKEEEAAAKRAKKSSQGEDAANVRGRVVQKGGAAAKKAKIIDLVGGSQ